MNLQNPSSWEVGLIVGAGTLLALLLAAIVYRVFDVLVGRDLAVLLLGLAVILGVSAWFIDWVSDRLAARRRAAEARRQGGEQ